MYQKEYNIQKFKIYANSTLFGRWEVEGGKWKTYSKMVEVNTFILDLKISKHFNKRQRMSNWLQKQDIATCQLQESHFNYKAIG